MSNVTQQIVSKAWNFAHVLRDEGLSYMAYTEQITFLLFLKMADEQTKPPYNRKPIVPKGFDWDSLLKQEGDDLEAHYRHILEELAKRRGMLGEIFKKARPEIQNPALLRRLIVDLIEPEKWFSMAADVKGDIYEGLLAKSAEESPKGAGQYFYASCLDPGHRGRDAANPRPVKCQELPPPTHIGTGQSPRRCVRAGDLRSAGWAGRETSPQQRDQPTTERDLPTTEPRGAAANFSIK